MPGASAHCCGMARFINRPHVATFMFIWPGRKKFLPINRKFNVILNSFTGFDKHFFFECKIVNIILTISLNKCCVA